MKGTVKRFFVKEGFGFIRCEDGPDVFVHYKGIQGNRRSLLEDEEVEFEIEMGPRGPRACKVRRLRSVNAVNGRTRKDRFTVGSAGSLKVGEPAESDFRFTREDRGSNKVRQFVLWLASIWPAKGIR